MATVRHPPTPIPGGFPSSPVTDTSWKVPAGGKKTVQKKKGKHPTVLETGCVLDPSYRDGTLEPYHTPVTIVSNIPTLRMSPLRTRAVTTREGFKEDHTGNCPCC